MENWNEAKREYTDANSITDRIKRNETEKMNIKKINIKID